MIFIILPFEFLFAILFESGTCKGSACLLGAIGPSAPFLEKPFRGPLSLLSPFPLPLVRVFGCDCSSKKFGPFLCSLLDDNEVRKVKVYQLSSDRIRHPQMLIAFESNELASFTPNKGSVSPSPTRSVSPSLDSIFNSPWILGAPQQFSRAICLISSRISFVMGRRPDFFRRRDNQDQ